MKLDEVRLPKEFDRRRKISDTDREDIRRRVTKGESIRAIARDTGFSRRAIDFIINPERLERCKKQYKARKQSAKTYARVRGRQWRDTQREHRAYKRRILTAIKVYSTM